MPRPCSRPLSSPPPTRSSVRSTGTPTFSTLPLVTEALDEAAGSVTRQIVFDLAATAS